MMEYVLILGLATMYSISYRLRSKLQKKLDYVRASKKVQQAFFDSQVKIHLDISAKAIDNAIIRSRSVYYVPRLNEIVEFKELEDLGEL